MSHHDTILAAKWTTRAAEWDRLAALARNEHIAQVCREMGEQAHMMARFWEGEPAPR